MLVPACRLEREQRLVSDAPVGEGGERTAFGPPGPDRREQADPGLLGQVLALAADGSRSLDTTRRTSGS